MSRFAVWSLVCLLVGVAFLANAMTIFLKRRRFLASAVRVSGTVVAVRLEGTGRNVVTFPTLEFATSTSEVQRTESLMGSGLQRFQVGDTVTVCYDPHQPARADVASFAVLWGLVVLRASFGVLFLLLAGVGLVAARS